MDAPPPSDLPGRHVSVTRNPHDGSSLVWQRRGVQVTGSLFVIGLISWIYGLTAAGGACVLGVAGFLISPGARLRMANAVRASRDGVWVSPPICVPDRGEAALLTIGPTGVSVTPGVHYATPRATTAWADITAIHLTGAPGRPDSLTIESERRLVLTGTFPAALLDQLVKYGVRVPGP